MGATQSRLAFDNDQSYDFAQQATTAFVGYSAPSGWSYRLAVGAIVGGELTSDAGTVFEMSPGVLANVSASRSWTLGDGSWFVTGTAGFSVAQLSTDAPGNENVGYTATDARIGTVLGKTFADKVSPYVLARAFAGPALWEVDGVSTNGSDPSHLQLGAGVAITAPKQLTVVLDVSVVGEQSAAVGLTWRI